MFEMSFSYRGAPVTLKAGASFHRSAPTGFTDAGAHEMREIIGAVAQGTPWRTEIERRFGVAKPWLRDVILSPRRTAFFDLLPPRARRVLDIGCGWGQMTLPLASRGLEVVAIEPGPHRLEFVEAAAKQDGIAQHIAFVGADYFDCAFPPAMDAILCIGVLEWIGAFCPTEDPRASQRRFLAETKRNLASGGALIIGIENRLGAKYLLGCPDDHLGVAGVACLPGDRAAKKWRAQTGHEMRSFTYADFELREMLEAAGYTRVALHAAFPDYKLPEHIIPIDADAGRAVNLALRAGVPAREHNGFDGSPLSADLEESLGAFYTDVARTGIGHHFAPSFFVVAT